MQKRESHTKQYIKIERTLHTLKVVQVNLLIVLQVVAYFKLKYKWRVVSTLDLATKKPVTEGLLNNC